MKNITRTYGVNNNVIDFNNPPIVKPPSLALITGGGNDLSGPNWLGNLTAGSRFLFRHRSKQGPQDVGVQQAEVHFKFKTCTLLFDGLNKGGIFYIVDNLDFSTIMKCVEVLPAVQGTEDGTST